MMFIHPLFLGKIGLTEILVILLIVVIFFGGKKIPCLLYTSPSPRDCS